MMKTRRAHLGFARKLMLFGAAAASIACAISERRHMSFAARTVVITGASRGLRLELARGFAREHANVVLLARNQEQLNEAKDELESMGASVSARLCDVSNEGEVRRAIASIAAMSPTIDVLINNAGTIHAGPSENTNLEDFVAAMGVRFD